MKITFPKFNKASVLVIGDVMLDRYWYGLTSHISPEAPVPIVKIDTMEERPGGAANVAMNIAGLGACAHLIGLIGEDHAAYILRKILKSVKVKYDFVVVKSHPTITKLRVLSRNQQLIRLDFEQEFNRIDLQLLEDRIYNSLLQVRVLVLSDYGKGTLNNNVQTIIQLARQIGIHVLVDPKGTDFKRYYGATLLTPNLSEFEAVVGTCKTENEIVSRGMHLMTDYNFAALLITRSEKGMTLLQPSKAPLHLPTQAQEVFDVTGAGDTVISVLASVLATGRSFEEASFFANVAAGVVVGKVGTSSINVIELKNAIYYASPLTSDFGILKEAELKVAVQQARRRGEKIVMTNGVFDILHAGHISYLRNARKLGDRLIVAVNSDQSTGRLKGDMRPINSLKNRMIVLSALEVVDWVVSFEEDTPRRLIKEVLPDFLVKGGDYTIGDIEGSKEVLKHGGDVQIINVEHYTSTSKIIKKILDNSN
ncbi:bifunctional D-glycero-beta-D-manno-heptose-7-phosphate kinase/D-glycero-beta-D-manno-heptose 1-phosphate adenylyltransferase HldE [Candidatus Pantoea carbekii]|uniref:Bifunctional protein HldE n=1 Tax=Candidatus Pantoea carbekii TaxID=1235990 RepID=U3U2D4_9GAMM|nr:bifunctional D-glycero-beta-D-manno-heptose-7-phosphate kinase/D-glycero-beta-D-manno-heptose 1-phosphate adenylyltransferase HldE [Candidatus Pantoea carbekii]AKC32548.1 bifunctional protein HldE [Candidatus Pantoea carbekii]BAO00276.1 bifunctional protein HldE [Candidatus Pantoea carbekii]